MNNKTKEIIKILNEQVSTTDQIELMANVLLNMGLSYMGADVSKMSRDELEQFIINDRKKQETIGNALATQALLMLLWIK